MAKRKILYSPQGQEAIEVPEHRVEFLKSIDANCPVLGCAVERGMDICSRDCKEFPCSKFDGWPLTKEWLEMYKTRLKTDK